MEQQPLALRIVHSPTVRFTPYKQGGLCVQWSRLVCVSAPKAGFAPSFRGAPWSVAAGPESQLQFEHAAVGLNPALLMPRYTPVPGAQDSSSRCRLRPAKDADKLWVLLFQDGIVTRGWQLQPLLTLLSLARRLALHGRVRARFPGPEPCSTQRPVLALILLLT